MRDLILHDIPPSLLARVQRLAAARGCSTQVAWMLLVDRGLGSVETPGDLDADRARVLKEATIALKNLRNDPGFALIGRTPVTPPRPGSPDQSISPDWSSPP